LPLSNKEKGENELLTPEHSTRIFEITNFVTFD